MKCFEKRIYENLVKKQQELKSKGLKKLFQDPARVEKFSIKIDGLLYDFSKNLLDEQALSLLLEQIERKNLKEKIDAMFSGEKINNTENRAVLHTALRRPQDQILHLDKKNIMEEVQDVFLKMKNFAKKLYSEEWRGSSDCSIKNIVNLGIGGSDLGPKMAYQALYDYRVNDLKFFYVSNVDGNHLSMVLDQCDPARTLFIISSKSFTTQETIANANAARDWLDDYFQEGWEIAKHFVAVTENMSKATEYGIEPENIFPMWDWVGGRYSLCSAIGISLLIAIGSENFESMLSGFYEIDEHFKEQPYSHNIPIIMALIGIWYRNFWNIQSYAILPYSQNLEFFPVYLQQLDMESNGKSVNQLGEIIDYQTSPVIWGVPGTDGQHTFYQMLHQGTQVIPCDFIGFINPNRPQLLEQHQILMSHFFAQQIAFAFGKDEEQLRAECSEELIPYRRFFGNRPTNCFLFDRLTPKNLGKLIALYEHKIFVQGILWDIYSFDQWGVELGKQIAPMILKSLKQKNILENLDSSTKKMLAFYFQRGH